MLKVQRVSVNLVLGCITGSVGDFTTNRRRHGSIGCRRELLLWESSRELIVAIRSMAIISIVVRALTGTGAWRRVVVVFGLLLAIACARGCCSRPSGDLGEPTRKARFVLLLLFCCTRSVLVAHGLSNTWGLRRGVKRNRAATLKACSVGSQHVGVASLSRWARMVMLIFILMLRNGANAVVRVSTFIGETRSRVGKREVSWLARGDCRVAFGLVASILLKLSLGLQVVERRTTSTAGRSCGNSRLSLEIVDITKDLHKNLLNTLEVVGSLVAQTLERSLEKVLLGSGLVQGVDLGHALDWSGAWVGTRAVNGLLKLLSVLDTSKDNVVASVLDEGSKLVHGGSHLQSWVHEQCNNLGVAGTALSIPDHEMLHESNDVLVLDAVDSLASRRIVEGWGHALRHTAHMASILGGVEGILASGVGRPRQRQLKRLTLGLKVGGSVVAIGHVTFIILGSKARTSGVVWGSISASAQKVIIESRVGNRAGVLVWVGDKGISLTVVRSTLPLILVLSARSTTAGSTLGTLFGNASRSGCYSAIGNIIVVLSIETLLHDGWVGQSIVIHVTKLRHRVMEVRHTSSSQFGWLIVREAIDAVSGSVARLMALQGALLERLVSEDASALVFLRVLLCDGLLLTLCGLESSNSTGGNSHFGSSGWSCSRHLAAMLIQIIFRELLWLVVWPSTRCSVPLGFQLAAIKVLLFGACTTAAVSSWLIIVRECRVTGAVVVVVRSTQHWLVDHWALHQGSDCWFGTHRGVNNIRVGSNASDSLSWSYLLQLAIIGIIGVSIIHTRALGRHLVEFSLLKRVQWRSRVVVVMVLGPLIVSIARRVHAPWVARMILTSTLRVTRDARNRAEASGTCLVRDILQRRRNILGSEIGVIISALGIIVVRNIILIIILMALERMFLAILVCFILFYVVLLTTW
jgi:hypothetical protein